MIQQLLQQEVQDFIKAHEQDDLDSLALKYRHVNEVDIKLILDQVRGRQKARAKLPGWYTCPAILYPPKISMEQCSSEIAARYKAELVSGKVLVDLSGGFGVDTFYLSQNFTGTHYVERDEWLYQLARHNHRALGANVVHHRVAAEEFLPSFETRPDVIYLDPARRDVDNKKVVRLEDCEPGITLLLPQLLDKAAQLLIKTSPLLDIDLSVKSLQFVSTVHVVAVNNEVKEVLYEVGPRPSSFRIKAINLSAAGTRQAFEFSREEERSAKVNFGAPGLYLYEPNAALMKAGAFKVLAERYSLKKLHANTHLYTHDELLLDFPGRKFVIKKVLPVDRKSVQKHLPGKKANVATRNFPLGAEALKKKLAIKDGGDIYLFGVTDLDGARRVLLARKTS